ncbi:hypothetical protein NBRC116598_01870 [Pseudophaeobacter arcticus]|uniref:Uncharacterized protein n=1 Tax=Pseudophaeobacter arcticus TaxID=385492 RepID=A0ABQ0AFW5_9RHOB
MYQRRIGDMIGGGLTGHAERGAPIAPGPMRWLPDQAVALGDACNLHRRWHAGPNGKRSLKKIS